MINTILTEAEEWPMSAMSYHHSKGHKTLKLGYYKRQRGHLYRFIQKPPPKFNMWEKNVLFTFSRRHSCCKTYSLKRARELLL